MPPPYFHWLLSQISYSTTSYQSNQNAAWALAIYSSNFVLSSSSVRCSAHLNPEAVAAHGSYEEGTIVAKESLARNVCSIGSV